MLSNIEVEITGNCVRCAAAAIVR